jgi:hypothetical protein
MQLKPSKVPSKTSLPGSREERARADRRVE